MRSPRQSSAKTLRFLPLIVLLTVAILAGCGDDNKKTPTTPGGGTPTTSSFTGVFLGAGAENGTVSITVQTTSLARSWNGAVVTATGSLKPSGGSAVSLTGTYDSDTDSLNLSGSGYTLAGTYDDNSSGDSFKSISGGYDGPNGIGFFGAVLGATSQIKVFLGTYENSGMTTSGKWDMVVADTLVGCIAFPDGGTADDAIAMSGTVERTGATRAMSFAGGGGTFTVTATGEWDTGTNTVSGTWDSEDTSIPTTDNGTWVGELAP